MLVVTARRIPDVYPDVVGPAPSGSAATDTALTLEAIGDTPEGGCLVMPGHPTVKTDPYLIQSKISAAKHITIVGRSMTELWTSGMTS